MFRFSPPVAPASGPTRSSPAAAIAPGAAAAPSRTYHSRYAAVAPGSAEDDVIISVIGMPGVGKSSVLNEVAGFKYNLFTEGAGAKSCSSKITRWKGVLRTEQGIDFSVVLGDTPGFPDTRPEFIVPYFDDVIEAVRERHHLILWVVSNDRVDAVRYQQVRFLFKQFKNLRCKVVMIVNGKTEISDRLSEAEQAAEAQKVLRGMTAPGGTVETYYEATGVQPDFVELSLNRKMLTKVCRDLRRKIHGWFTGSPAKRSPALRTVRELKGALEDVKESKNEEERKASELEEEIAQVEKRCENLRQQIEECRYRYESDEKEWHWFIWPIWWYNEDKYDKDAEHRRLIEAEAEAEVEAQMLKEKQEKGEVLKETREEAQRKITQAENDLMAINTALGVMA